LPRSLGIALVLDLVLPMTMHMTLYLFHEPVTDLGFLGSRTGRGRTAPRSSGLTLKLADGFFGLETALAVEFGWADMLTAAGCC
jgi:hypothetical protein